MRNLILFATMLLLTVNSSLCAPPPPGSPLIAQKRSIVLKKDQGQVDQLKVLNDGSMLVRDSNFKKPEMQAIELYGANGEFLRKIGRFGMKPGEYFRLEQIGFQNSDQTIWAVDLKNRITRFRLNGTVANTVLVQNPGPNPTGFSLDEQRGVFFLAGCVSIVPGTTSGCHVAFKYGIGDSRLLTTYLDTAPEPEQNFLLPLEAWMIDTDFEGNLFAIDMPLFQLFRVSAKTGRLSTSTVRSWVARPTTFVKQHQMPSYYDDQFRRASLLDRVVVAGEYVIVSISSSVLPRLLEIFDRNGSQVAVDVPAPGRLVGVSSRNELIFVTEQGRDVKVGFYTISTSASKRINARSIQKTGPSLHH